MSSLNKLAIRGIRSFDDKQISVIEFFSPVTVIVGHNGSGKTTIIECLKYATTGDQPPNTRGGAFVHDPKLANEKEVKAQVKLRFHAANGKRMLAVRNLSVTATKKGLTMKTLENVLSLADGSEKTGGKRGTISTKCAEMDSEIPQLFGVSKAVLESVIFCHQEDSYWPLAEASVLKKKFDEIFEATKYTKALNSIKDLRKERMSDLKAEKERLESLSKEKGHADKLKERMAKLAEAIAKNESAYEKAKNQYDTLMKANQQLQDQSYTFTQKFTQFEQLQKDKQRLEVDLEDMKMNYDELPDTDDELQKKENNFGDHVNKLKNEKSNEEEKLTELKEGLTNAQKRHNEAKEALGAVKGNAEAHKNNLQARDKMIRLLSTKYGIKGYTQTSDASKVLEFMSRLEDMKRVKESQLGGIQSELKDQIDIYTAKSRELSATVEKHNAKKQSLRDQINERNRKIAETNKEFEASGSMNPEAELSTLNDEIEEKRSRISKLTSDITEANRDKRLKDLGDKQQNLEKRQGLLNSEFKSLSSQSDLRAKLDLQRNSMKSKTVEMTKGFETVQSKFQRLAGMGTSLKNLTVDVDRLIREKESEISREESESKTANFAAQEAEVNLSSLKKELQTKKEELKDVERQLKDAFETETLELAIKDATDEVKHGKNMAGSLVGASSVFVSFLKTGRETHVCVACDRAMDQQELSHFEDHMTKQIDRHSPEKIAENAQTTADWEEELERLQNLRPVQATRDRLKSEDIPSLEAKVKKAQEDLTEASASADEAKEKMETAKQTYKDVQSLSTPAHQIPKLQKEIDQLKDEVKNDEQSLAASGSTKTIGDLEVELQELAEELDAVKKERASLTAEKERQQNSLRTFENQIHAMELQAKDLENKIHLRKTSESNVTAWKEEIDKFTKEIKATEALLTDAQVPIDALKDEHNEKVSVLEAKIKDVQKAGEDLNRDHDSLSRENKTIMQYVTSKAEEKLQRLVDKIKDLDDGIAHTSEDIESAQKRIAAIEKQISESAVTISNIRDNVKFRKRQRELKDCEKQLLDLNMDEAYKARRIFQEKMEHAKNEEYRYQGEYQRLSGELTSQRATLAQMNSDMKEFLDVTKQYTDQLIKVKMSDMANNDLEKYSKALDNAIMKYHSLKMEEVNETMRFLWNRTYQGTDIDGIKIRSDMEGGTSKRSYNYRVVMTKDQVEMDMRGRCSAGQKMLASIIIRLALSDSFGQNCGILALDEPTNALDTENIEALAASLVDIINERKGNSNFQLIIITHDENFLRKLGQADVMEYYWRVSRDTRQKSIIERQRFR